MSFVEGVLSRLAADPERPVLQAWREGSLRQVTAKELLASAARVRRVFQEMGLRAGDRCGIVAPNSPAWVAADIAMLSEGIVSVPLYSRQTPAELAFAFEDAAPKLVLADESSAGVLRDAWNGGVPIRNLDELVDSPTVEDSKTAGAALGPEDPITIRYTSGTSGAPKGAILTRGNVDHMLSCTTSRLNAALQGVTEQERIFHYLPFCFAGSWILLWTALSRGALLTLSTETSRVAQDLAAARPHTFLNVPLLLERMRGGIEDKLHARGGMVARLFDAAFAATLRRANGTPQAPDAIVLQLARSILFSRIRTKLSPDLRVLICGSAPLSRETQIFFEMLGIPVLQVYGLTETTAICTMDYPGRVSFGRVGEAIEGVEIQLSPDGEILVRGPNVFPGYWNRPEANAAVFSGGWLRTGDRGDVDEQGRWRITGRVKNVMVLSSGHNVAPEPLEDAIRAAIPRARTAVEVGHGRPHLAAFLTGGVSREDAERALTSLNQRLPHYQRIHSFALLPEEAIESSCFTANGKLRRDAIAERLADQIETLYSGARA
jgi:long-chain acyl-CoA synthetase